MEWNSSIIFLGICSYFDLKEQKIKSVWIGVAGIAACIFQMYFRNESVWSIVGGVGTGAFLLLMSWLSKEQIGYGDGYVFIVLGVFLGLNKTIEVLMISLGCSFVYSLYLLLIKKKKGTDSYPFIPFVFLASAMLWTYGKFGAV